MTPKKFSYGGMSGRKIGQAAPCSTSMDLHLLSGGGRETSNHALKASTEICGGIAVLREMEIDQEMSG